MRWPPDSHKQIELKKKYEYCLIPCMILDGRISFSTVGQLGAFPTFLSVVQENVFATSENIVLESANG